jgi:hypothetical protein
MLNLMVKAESDKTKYLFESSIDDTMQALV